MADIHDKIQQFVISGDSSMLNTVMQMALDAGGQASDLLNNGLLPAMDLVGQKMKTGDMFIPEVLMAARTMQSGLELLTPHMEGGDSMSAGTCVVGTVEGDLHDIGKNLVSMMLSGAGFKVIDLGVDVKAPDFVKAVQENDAQIIGMSSLLTTTMVKMEETIKCVAEAGMRERVKVIIGGAPVTQQYADTIGADGYAFNAPDAVQKAKELVAAVAA
ncbi:corrinoid protein [Desulfobulbus rhabdoformis]|uniref:corrinoid protein n=1 Tax=Desulfobulbus rhabdoformis TaxID=34032 RepID=UPI001965622F|nr:corrinoid protein [Desulfobulbus rhabdoformis]MBM9615904.1 corrinoid protein [Desulfobulbus rhabdoformis]